MPSSNSLARLRRELDVPVRSEPEVAVPAAAKQHRSVLGTIRYKPTRLFSPVPNPTASGELTETRRVVLGPSGLECKYDRYLADVFLPTRSLKASSVPMPFNRSKAEIGAVPATVNEKKVKAGAGGTWPAGGQVFTDAKGNESFLNNLLLQEGLAVRMGE